LAYLQDQAAFRGEGGENIERRQNKGRPEGS